VSLASFEDQIGQVGPKTNLWGLLCSDLARGIEDGKNMGRRVAFKNPGAPLNVAPLSVNFSRPGRRRPQGVETWKLHRRSPLTPRTQRARQGAGLGQFPGWAIAPPVQALFGSDWMDVRSQDKEVTTFPVQNKKVQVTDMAVLM
jgi:hypothetical protein